jgi:hypothetical protein
MTRRTASPVRAESSADWRAPFGDVAAERSGDCASRTAGQTMRHAIINRRMSGSPEKVWSLDTGGGRTAGTRPLSVERSGTPFLHARGVADFARQSRLSWPFMPTIDAVNEHLRRHYGIDEHLRRHYGIGAARHRVPEGRAENYRVDCNAGRWLFKVLQPEYTVAHIERAADFVSFAVASGCPAREFVASRDGARVHTLDGRAAVLIPWIDGETPEPNSVSAPHLLAQIGALCGKAHRVGAAYPRSGAFEYSGSTRSLSEKRAALLALATGTDEIAAEARARANILDTLGTELERSYARARRGIIHGDFSAAHVVFREDAAVGVIDLLGELYLPRWN